MENVSMLSFSSLDGEDEGCAETSPLLNKMLNASRQANSRLVITIAPFLKTQSSDGHHSAL